MFDESFSHKKILIDAFLLTKQTNMKKCSFFGHLVKNVSEVLKSDESHSVNWKGSEHSNTQTFRKGSQSFFLVFYHGCSSRSGVFSLRRIIRLNDRLDVVKRIRRKPRETPRNTSSKE